MPIYLYAAVVIAATLLHLAFSSLRHRGDRNAALHVFDQTRSTEMLKVVIAPKAREKPVAFKLLAKALRKAMRKVLRDAGEGRRRLG